MKNLFYFTLGIILITLVSATTVSIMTVKPSTPKTFIVKYFYSESDAGNVSKFIMGKMKEGWILKQVSGTNDGEYYSTWIVVMEKYKISAS